MKHILINNVKNLEKTHQQNLRQSEKSYGQPRKPTKIFEKLGSFWKREKIEIVGDGLLQKKKIC